MNVLSKIKETCNISKKLELELYPLRCMIITSLCTEITKSIYHSERKFYCKYIQPNKAFSKIIEYMMSKSYRGKLSFYKKLDDKKATLMLILFAFEEFIHAWTSEFKEFRLEDVPEQMEVFRLYTKEIEKVNIETYDLHVPMITRDKPICAITFQMIYTIAIVLMHKDDLPGQLIKHVENVIAYYEKHQTIEPLVGKFDEDYLMTCLTQVYIVYNIPHYVDLAMFSKLKEFKLDIYKFVNMLIYVWIVYNPYPLKEYNDLLSKMFTSTVYEIQNTSDEKEVLQLIKRQYEIVHARGKYKYIEIVNEIQNLAHKTD